MKIELWSTDSTPVLVATLASETNDATNHCGPASAVRGLQEAKLQESNPIGSSMRRMFNRKNAGGTITFTVKPQYGSLDAAAVAVGILMGRASLSGTLAVTARGANSASWSRANATVHKVEAQQIGVSVEAKYEIVF